VVRDHSFNSTHMSCNLIQFCTEFLQWFRCNSFTYFSSLPRRSNISIRNILEAINKSYSFSENDSKHKMTLANICFGKSRSCLYRSNNFCHLWLLKKLRLIVTGSCNSSRHQYFMRKKFFKMKLMKTFPRNSITGERLGNIYLL